MLAHVSLACAEVENKPMDISKEGKGISGSASTRFSSHICTWRLVWQLAWHLCTFLLPDPEVNVVSSAEYEDALFDTYSSAFPGDSYMDALHGLWEVSSFRRKDAAGHHAFSSGFFRCSLSLSLLFVT